MLMCECGCLVVLKKIRLFGVIWLGLIDMLWLFMLVVVCGRLILVVWLIM